MDLINSLDKDHDGGCTQFEFVVGMITKLGLVAEEDVAPFIEEFHSLDRDGSGRLTSADLRELARRRSSLRQRFDQEKHKQAARGHRSSGGRGGLARVSGQRSGRVRPSLIPVAVPEDERETTAGAAGATCEVEGEGRARGLEIECQTASAAE